MATVRERLMGADNGWVPLDLCLLRPGLERCKNNAQRAVLLVLFAIWQESQRKGEPSWEFPASTRTVCSRLGLKPSQRTQAQEHLSALIELGVATVIEPARPRRPRVLSLQSSLDSVGKGDRVGNSVGRATESDATRSEGRPSTAELGRKGDRVEAQLGRIGDRPLRGSVGLRPPEQNLRESAAPASLAGQGPAADAARREGKTYSGAGYEQFRKAAERLARGKEAR